MAKKIISGMNSPAFPSRIGVGVSKRYWTAVMIAQGHFIAESKVPMNMIAEDSFKMTDALLEQEDKSL